jgi:hypothetical protein
MRGEGGNQCGGGSVRDYVRVGRTRVITNTTFSCLFHTIIAFGCDRAVVIVVHDNPGCQLLRGEDRSWE